MLHRRKDLLHSTAEFKVPSFTNGNGDGHARNGGNGHRHRPRRQIHHGYRRAALRADTAVMLVANGMTVTEAVTRCDVSLPHYYAMRALKESGNVALHNRALKGDQSVRVSAARVKNAAAAITALTKCSGLERELVRAATGMTSDPVTMLLNLTPEQLVATSTALGLDWVWDHMIAAAMPTKPATESTKPEPAVMTMMKMDE
jgi:hypothetical protein